MIIILDSLNERQLQTSNNRTEIRRNSQVTTLLKSGISLAHG